MKILFHMRARKEYTDLVRKSLLLEIKASRSDVS